MLHNKRSVADHVGNTGFFFGIEDATIDRDNQFQGCHLKKQAICNNVYRRKSIQVKNKAIISTRTESQAVIKVYSRFQINEQRANSF